MILGHTIRLDPTKKQADKLARAAGCARFAYNWGLGEWERRRAAGVKPKIGEIKKTFNALKRESFPWIYESPKDANQQAFADLGQAFTNFFRWAREGKGPRVGHPTRRKKGQGDAFYVSNDKFRIGRFSVTLPVIGVVRMHESLRLVGKIMGARVCLKAGRWSIAVQVEGDHRRPTTPSRAIAGIDLGLKTAFVISRSERGIPEPVDSPRPLRAALRSLRRANRRMHRREKGSRNRHKARLHVARIHARVANIRKDFMHKITTRLCRENQAVCIEDLNVKGMMANHCLARAISDVGFGMFRQFVTYKGPIYGCEVTIADRFFPSSKRCSRCGHVKEMLSLSERTYTCDVCGMVKDRDENAALNLESYPRLAGNGRKATPMDDFSSTLRAVSQSKMVVEVGTKPGARVHTN